MSAFSKVGIAALVASLALAACTNKDPASGTTAYKAGELGNGGFTFSCADTNTACLQPASADARTFPSGVAKGTTFRVRYVPNPGVKADINVELDDKSGSANGSASGPTQGSLTAVGNKFLDKGPDGFVAKASGAGSIVARDASGALIEFTTIAIKDAARLQIYEAQVGTATSTAPSVQTISIPVSQQASFRIVAQDASKQNLGGSFPADWKSGDDSIVTVDSQDHGVVNLVGRKAGTTTMTVSGLGLTMQIPVEVK